MDRKKNPAKKKLVRLEIGKDELCFKPETKKSIDIELFLLNVPLFIIVGIYSFDLIPWPIFLLLFYVIAMRIFIGNHDRYHADVSVRLPKFWEKISEGFAIVVTPWDEPYDSIRRKHLKHHESHDNGESSKYDTKNDPHSVFELGGFFRVLMSCMFYEEIQFYFDLRDGKLTRSRLYRFLIYVPLLILFVLTFGWIKFLIILLAMRIVGFTAWFVFSWIIHQPIVYRFGFSSSVPKLFKQIFLVLHGRRVTEGVIHHATHHTWPLIPAEQLYRFDTACTQNPGFNRDVQAVVLQVDYL